VLLIVVAVRGTDPWKIVSFSVYAAILLILHLTSSLYHSLQGAATNVLRKMDHLRYLSFNRRQLYTIHFSNAAWCLRLVDVRRRMDLGLVRYDSGIVGYNVQTAVDAKHHLNVEHEVTNSGSDRDQLSAMAKKARTAIGTTTLTAIVDRGRHVSSRILMPCEFDAPPSSTRTERSRHGWDGRTF
jgi:hypothetical protein